MGCGILSDYDRYSRSFQRSVSDTSQVDFCDTDHSALPWVHLDGALVLAFILSLASWLFSKWAPFTPWKSTILIWMQRRLAPLPYVFGVGLS